jgi:anti-sigma regulatory factor (Ser/Thr protein kinase)
VTAVRPAPERVGLEHPALLYEGVDDLVGGLAPYVASGVQAGETVFVAARGDYLPPLAAALGDLASGAELVDTSEWHPHPSRRLRAFHELVTQGLASGVARFRLAGEPVWPSGPPELVREWQRHESVLNAVLAPYPVSLVCLYDASALDPAILEGAHCTHRVVTRNGGMVDSELFEQPDALLPRWNPEPAAPPPSASGIWVSELWELPPARAFVVERALGAGLSAEKVGDLSVAVSEVLANALVHGGGAARMWVWPEQEHFVCQVHDTGSGPSDPLAGYRPPEWVESGRGLWVARQLVELLQIVPGLSGTTVRLVAAV